MTTLQPFAYADFDRSRNGSDLSRAQTAPRKRAVPPKGNRPHGHNTRRHTAGILLLAICLTGCARAPSFDILGSFFPAWLLCLAVGLLLSFAAGWLLSRLGIVIAVPILTYPCLTVLFACALWLAFFH